MDNEYEIDSFEIDGEVIPATPEQEPVAQEQEPVAVEESAAEESVVAEEATAWQKKESPFADSPYIVNEQPKENSWQKPAKQPRNMGKLGKRIIAAVLVVALVAAGCGITALCVNGYWNVRMNGLYDDFAQQIEDLQQQIQANSFTGNGNSISGTVNTPGEGMTPGQVYAQNVKSVVSVAAKDTSSGGSGFIISEDGYIVSNYHVIEGANQVSVYTYDENEYPAKIVGYDQANDVAVLKVEATGLQAAKIGSSDNLIVGDQVVAIGHPLGNETATLTVGYVSAKDQSVTTDGTRINMLQTDAAINSGNSGGPLFNMNGEVIGITTAKYSGTTSSGASIESIGFAIPIDDVVKKMQDLIDFGYVTGAYLGVSVMDMNTDVMDAFGFPNGAYVAEVVPGYCAAKAGIQPKDMIIAVGGYEVDSVNGLTRALGKFNPGDKTVILVWRAGAELELPITFDEKPAPESETQTPAATQPQATQPQQDDGWNWWDDFFGG